MGVSCVNPAYSLSDTATVTTMDLSSCSGLSGVKLILTDFDGTFLDSKHNISKANAKAFGDLVNAGVIAAVASGRSRIGTLASMSPELRTAMKYDGYPGIFLNGGVVYGKNGEVLSCTVVPASAQKLLLDKMEELGILNNILGYTADRVLCIEKNPYTMKSYAVYKEPEPDKISLEEFMTTGFVKLVVCGTIESTDRVRPILEPQLQEYLRCVRPLDWNIEFVNRSVSKAVGAKLLLSHLEISPPEVLAMGDGENDIQLLRLAGVSVSVANACDSAKTAADYCTVCNDDCAFHAVAQHVLSAREPCEP